MESEAARGGGRACRSDFLQTDGGLDANPGRPGCGMADAVRADAYGRSRVSGARAHCQIAAINHWRGMTVTTRNVRGFDRIGINIVNQWTAG